MKVEFKYSYVFDLVYHVLAHMQVNNPSNLYSEEYIAMIREVKAGQGEDICRALEALGKYYNDHFEQLCMINFVPFQCSELNDLKDMLKAYPGFTSQDREYFIDPFLELLERENSFYMKYWNQLFEESESGRNKLEVYLKKELEKYQQLGKYYQKELALIGISFSMTCNGRGLGNAAAFMSTVPYAEKEEDYQNVFLQILHEFTHQFTDGLIQQNISMDDGSHYLSEVLVILFDYYLIKKLYPNELKDYLFFMTKGMGMDETIMTEELFLTQYEVSEDWKNKLQLLVEKIAELY